jgi:hypothetical protein
MAKSHQSKDGVRCSSLRQRNDSSNNDDDNNDDDDDDKCCLYNKFLPSKCHTCHIEVTMMMMMILMMMILIFAKQILDPKVFY